MHAHNMRGAHEHTLTPDTLQTGLRTVLTTVRLGQCGAAGSGERGGAPGVGVEGVESIQLSTYSFESGGHYDWHPGAIVRGCQQRSVSASIMRLLYSSSC